MALPRKSANRYELQKSALYRLPTARALAYVLEWEGTPSALRALSRRKDLFDQYEKKNQKTGKVRNIQAPVPLVKPLQKRLNKLLKQIKVPDYLQSGVPGRSHLSNSKHHLDALGATVTVDITSFYETISRRRVFRLFRNVFECEPDVADMLADLVCCNGHLATGSPASVLLSFFCCRDLFDLMDARAKATGATFTLYVDDVAITGNTLGHGDVAFLESVLSRFGFSSKREKARIFRKGDAKTVTGRVFRNGVSRAPNKKHKELHDNLQASKTGRPSTRRTRSIVGQLEHIGLLDEKRAQKLKEHAKKLRSTLPPPRRRSKSTKTQLERTASEPQ